MCESVLLLIWDENSPSGVTQTWWLNFTADLFSASIIQTNGVNSMLLAVKHELKHYFAELISDPVGSSYLKFRNNNDALMFVLKWS